MIHPLTPEAATSDGSTSGHVFHGAKWHAADWPGSTSRSAGSLRHSSAAYGHRGRKRHPTLRDFVVVYANATILGGDTVIGERAVIGSNVWLTHSVDADTLVLLKEPQLRLKGPQDRDLGALMYHI